MNEVQVVRVIDGDTLDILISDIKYRVRLFGVDTPERRERCYEEATERTRHCPVTQCGSRLDRGCKRHRHSQDLVEQPWHSQYMAS